VIVLGVDAVHGKVRLALAQFRRLVEALEERTAGEVAVDKRVRRYPDSGPGGEVPVIIVGFVQEVEAV